MYLSDLAGQVKQDQAAYARAIFLSNGLTLAANARAWGNAWFAYEERDLTVDDMAREHGVTRERLSGALWKYANAEQARVGFYDPVIAGMITDPPEVTIRDHAEEVYGLIQAILRTY